MSTQTDKIRELLNDIGDIIAGMSMTAKDEVREELCHKGIASVNAALSELEAQPSRAVDLEATNGAGLMHEDDLPNTMTQSEYGEWYKNSLVIDGVRMGPVFQRAHPSEPRLTVDQAVEVTKRWIFSASNTDIDDPEWKDDKWITASKDLRDRLTKAAH